jgi:hypothetical protein
VSKKSLDPMHSAYRSLVPNLPPSRRLLKRKSLVTRDRLETVFETEGTTNRFFSQPVIRMTEDAFRVLQGADGKQTIARLLQAAHVETDDAIAPVMVQLLDMWSKRAIVLRPAKGGLETYVKKLLNG